MCVIPRTPYEELFHDLLAAGRDEAIRHDLPRDLDAVRFLAIGPRSSYDHVNVEVGGRLLNVARGAPFVGEIPLGQSGSRQLLLWRPEPGHSGFTLTADFLLERFGVHLQVANFVPPFVARHRAPIYVTGSHVTTSNVQTERFRCGVWGRDKIVLSAHNFGSNIVAYVLQGLVWDPAAGGVETHVLTSELPGGDGLLGNSENQHTVLLDRRFDTVRLTSASNTDTELTLAGFRLEAYDRE